MNILQHFGWPTECYQSGCAAIVGLTRSDLFTRQHWWRQAIQQYYTSNPDKLRKHTNLQTSQYTPALRITIVGGCQLADIPLVLVGRVLCIKTEWRNTCGVKCHNNKKKYFKTMSRKYVERFRLTLLFTKILNYKVNSTSYLKWFY